MTYQQITENVLEAFPTKTETQVKIDVNTALRRFAEASKCYILDANLTLDGTLILAYPTDMIVPVSIQAFDAISGGNKLDDLIEWTVTRSKIEFTDIDVPSSTTMPSTIKRLSLKYIAYAPALTTDTTAPAIPSEFHEALEYAVMAKYAQKAGKWQSAREFNGMYRQLLHDAQAYAATQFIGGGPTVEPSAI